MGVDVVPVRRRPLGMSVALAAALVLFQLVCPLVIAAQGSRFDTTSFTKTSDIARYRSIAQADGRPYRDFKVEYPPLAYGMFRAAGPSSFEGFRLRILSLQIACQAFIVFMLLRVWGGRAAAWYLLLSAPMLFVVYGGYDLVGVALAVGGAALVKRDHPAVGGLGLVVGAFTKVWPAVLLPVLVVRRQLRAFAVGAGAGLAGLAVWTRWAGTGAIGQVLTYRGARGWEYESIPGSLLRLFTRDSLHFEAGSWRVGAPPHAVSLLLSASLVGVVAGIWWRASRHADLRDGIAETAVIAAALVVATLLSPQFLIWLLPFAAIATAAGSERLLPWAGATAFLTLLVRVSFDPAQPALLRNELAIGARNLALVGLLVVAVLELRQPSNRRQRVGAQATL